MLNALLVSVIAWSCIALRAALNAWRMEVWLPTWESMHTEIITSLFKFSLSSKCITACSSHMVHWHAPSSNPRAKEGQRTGHSGQLSCEGFHCTGKLGRCWFDISESNKAGTGAAADTVHCFWHSWILEFGTMAFYSSHSAKGWKLLKYIELNVCNLKT